MVMEDYNQNPQPQPQPQEHAIDKPLNDSRSLETEYRGSIPNSGTPGEVKEFLYSFDSLSELLENSGNTIVDVADLDMVSTDATVENDGFEGQLEKSHQNVLASVTAEAADVQAQMQLPTESAHASNELISITQYDSSEPNPTPITKPFSAPDNDDHVPKMDQNKFSNQKTKSSRTIMKTPTSDGYNWRKYGQKQVKNTESSRSYYRCTNSDCRAKKNVRHCDRTGCIIEIVYKGQHNHDLPQKVRRSSTNRSESGSSLAVGSDSVNLLAQKLDNSESSIIKRQDSSPTSELEEHDYSDSDGDAVIRAEEENNYELKPRQRIETEEPMVLSSQGKRPRSTSSDEIFGIEAEEEHGDEQKEKRRMKGSTSTAGYSPPICKAIKESKIVVHATGDVGISSDGYRWRKYGQKMVKGSPHPRSYYRCTSAGCPVRKHVERATDDSTVTIITYEGKHDHDMPVPKKRHGPPKTALLMAAAEAINSGHFEKTETCSYQRSSTQWSLDKTSESTGENALELGGEKALESARTLLSIGIELRPC